jgi:ATP-dependent Clp protease ATP-binding subunit ClpC
MFAFFTDRAKQVMTDARAECLQQSAVMIEPRHLLAGILNCDACVASAALKRVGVDVDALWAVVAPEASGEIDWSRAVPFDPTSKRALTCSFDEAKNLGHRRIGTEHLLLGIARVEQRELARALARIGATLERLRLTVREVLGEAIGP